MAGKQNNQLSRIESKLDALDTKIDEVAGKVTIHVAQHVAVDKCIEDHEIILRGADKADGLIATAKSNHDRINIVYGIMGTLGIATVGLLVWLVENALTVAKELATKGLVK